MVFKTSRFEFLQKLAHSSVSVLILTANAVLADSGFTAQRRLGYEQGDQWEPALAAGGGFVRRSQVGSDGKLRCGSSSGLLSRFGSLSVRQP